MKIRATGRSNGFSFGVVPALVRSEKPLGGIMVSPRNRPEGLLLLKR